jgi:hypothetical protein
MMHRHSWVIINQFVTKSEVEALREMGLQATSFNSLSTKYVTDFKCEVCGKIKRKVIKSAH